MEESGVAKLSCAVVVSSCDAYSDLWVPFFNLFWKFWPDCPFPVYLVCNHKKFSGQKVKSLCVGDDLDWSQNLRKVLLQLDSEFVLFMLEDFFLRRRIHNKSVVDALEFLGKLKGDMLRLVPYPRPDDRVDGFPLLGHISAGAPYRVSTQGAFWRREALINLLRDGESIWEFELNGSRRSDVLNGFYSVWKSVLTYDHHVIERGKWFPHEVSRFGSMDIGCVFSRRPIMSQSEMLRWRLLNMRKRILMLLPWPQRIRLGRFIRQLLHK